MYILPDCNINQESFISGQFRPLRICILGYRSKPHCGGQGVYIKYLSAAMVKLGHEVDVISGEPYPDLDSNVRLIKMPGLNLFDKKKRLRALRIKDISSYTNLFEWFSVVTGGFPEPFTFGRRIVKYFKRTPNSYDLVHDNQSLCYGLLDLQKMNIPVVASIHHPITKDCEIALASATGWKQRLLIRRWHSFLRMQRYVVRNLDHLLTVSNQSRQDIAEAFKISALKINCIYNGIDTDDFSPLPEVKRLPRRLMATASADVPLKGLDYLLKALANLIPYYPDLELLVIGSPKPDGPTAKLVEKLGIGPNLIFVNNLETHQIKRYYAEATIAVIPSIYEGFGLPAGEAMSCGVPVIATTGGALPEVVGDAGILIQPGNVNALTSAIADLLKNPEKRNKLGNAARQRILGKFSWMLTAKKITNYYYCLLENADS